MGKVLILKLVVGFALLLGACGKDVTAFNQEQIVGKWAPVDKEVMCGYRFSADGSCEKDIGFFEYVDATPCTFDRPEWTDKDGKKEFVLPLNHTIRYYRSNSSYTIRKDSLLIVDPALKGWSRRQIHFLTADTLVISDGSLSTPEYYVREKTVDVNREPLFDYVFIYYPPTDFTSEQYYLLSHTGQYVNIDNAGWIIKGVLRETDYERLEQLYHEAEILDYLDSFPYEDSFSADEPAIVVVRNNRIYKLRNDLSKVPAKDVRNYYQAYVSTLFYPDNLYFKPDENDYFRDLLYRYKDFRTCEICSGEKKLALSEFSCFILTLLVRFSPSTDQPFLTEYELNVNRGYITMQTDGRYFRYRLEEKWPLTTVDIGFNFLESCKPDK